MRYFFRVEYDGTNYHGWQRQPNGTSVEEELERAFAIVVRTACVVVGGGRTDTGVHARRQGAHIDLPPVADLHTCERSVNAVLPRDIAIFGLRPVSEDFHARYSAVERRYRYYLTQKKAPLVRDRVWVATYPMDWERMRREMAALVGTHDFATFCAAGSDGEHAICTVVRTGLESAGDQWVFSLWANRFVYRMVRSIVGTVVEIGRGARADSLAEILASRDRGRAGPSAPARGLVLDDIIYPGVDT